MGTENMLTKPVLALTQLKSISYEVLQTNSAYRVRLVWRNDHRHAAVPADKPYGVQDPVRDAGGAGDNPRLGACGAD